MLALYSPCTVKISFPTAWIPQEAHVDIQSITVLVHQGIRFDLLNTFFDSAEANQLIELLLALTDFQQTLFVDPHKSKGIQFDHFVIQCEQFFLCFVGKEIKCQNGRINVRISC